MLFDRVFFQLKRSPWKFGTCNQSDLYLYMYNHVYIFFYVIDIFYIFICAMLMLLNTSTDFSPGFCFLLYTGQNCAHFSWFTIVYGETSWCSTSWRVCRMQLDLCTVWQHNWWCLVRSFCRSHSTGHAAWRCQSCSQKPLFLTVILRWIPQVFALSNTIEIAKYGYHMLRFQCSAEFSNLVSSFYCQPGTWTNLSSWEGLQSTCSKHRYWWTPPRRSSWESQLLINN